MADIDIFFDQGNTSPDIQAACSVVVGFISDREVDLIGDELYVTIRIMVDRSIDRTAERMSENEHKAAAKMFRSILNAAKLVAIDDIPGNADNKQVSDTGREDTFWNDS